MLGFERKRREADNKSSNVKKHYVQSSTQYWAHKVSEIIYDRYFLVAAFVDGSSEFHKVSETIYGRYFLVATFLDGSSEFCWLEDFVEGENSGWFAIKYVKVVYMGNN